MSEYVINVNDGPMHTTVEVDGRQIYHLTCVAVRHEVMSAPRLELHLNAHGIVRGRGRVVYLIGGEEFTAADIDTCRDAGLYELSDRLAAAMSATPVAV